MFGQFIPVILADIEGFFGIVFFLIAFVGWVINLVNQNQEAQKRAPKRPGGPQVRSQTKSETQREIEQFLQQSQRSSKRMSEFEVDDVEVIAPPARRAPPRRRRTREEIIAEQAGTPPALQKPQRAETRTQLVHERKSQSSKKKRATLPNKVQATSKFTAMINADLPHAVDQSVSSHLQKFTADSPSSTGQLGMASTTLNRKSKGNLIGDLLRTKRGVQNAIILNEILSPPKSRRT